MLMTMSNTLIRSFLVIWAVVATSSLEAQPQVPKHECPTTRQEGATVKVGEVGSASAGEALYAEFDFQSAPTVKLEGPVVHNETIRLSGGERLLAFRGKKGLLFCSSRKVTNLSGDEFFVCLADRKEKGLFDSFAVVDTRSGVVRFRWLKRLEIVPPIEYETAMTPLPTNFSVTSSGDRNFRREVVFEGVTGETLRLMYREFVDDLARPAFNQELTFKLNKDGPTMVAVKGAVLEFLEIGNLGAKAKLIKPFARPSGL